MYKAKDYIVAINGDMYNFTKEVGLYCYNNRLIRKDRTRAEHPVSGDRYFFTDCHREDDCNRMAGITATNVIFIGEPKNDRIYYYLMGRIRGG